MFSKIILHTHCIIADRKEKNVRTDVPGLADGEMVPTISISYVTCILAL